MSMLAERKQKQKWTLNPRGKYWSDDSNKFGQKMLEKMGWSAGKGLGAKLDGITEHIKQSYKNDTKGVGFEDREDQWTQHESDFSTLLQSLGNTDVTQVKKPEVSLEIKSQSSRKRVHYHKFTRGKDLTRYSEKDLANIFGRKTLEKKQKRSIETSPNEESNSNSSENNSKEFGVMTVNGGSMADYFKSKLKTVISKPKDEEQSDDERPGFGFSQTTTFESNSEPKESTFTSKFMSMFTSSENTKTTTEEIQTENENQTKEKSKKKKNKTKVVINECFDNMGFADFSDANKETKSQQDTVDSGFQNDGFEELTPVPIRKSKKRKLETIIEEPTIINESTTLNQEKEETYTPVKKKGKKEKPKLINEVPIIVEDDSKKKSKKGKGIDNQACTELEDDNVSLETKDNEKEPKKSKKEKAKIINEIPIIIEEDGKKKNTKKCKGIDNQACTELEENSLSSKTNENEIETVVEPKKKSKNKKKGIDNIACTKLVEENITFEEPIEKSSKKKNKNKSAGICNLACTELDNKENNVVTEENFDIKTSAKKKKKRTFEAGIYNVACTEDNKNDLLEVPSAEVVEMNSGKKKRKNKDDIGISNPACTENSDESIIIEENETSIPSSSKKSKKKKSKDSGVDNIACTANTVEQNLEEAISSMSNAIDDYQLELENQMNEKKVSNTKEEEFKPKFKSNKNFNYVKKSVKHVIKGTLRYEFEGSNLPQIPGYGIDR